MTTRIRKHEIEDLSRSHLRLIFEKAGWTVEDLSKDYGEDMMVRIFEDNRATPHTFFIQAKSTDHMERHLTKDGNAVFFDLDCGHLIHWRRFWEPVILTLWDAKTSITYWDYVQYNLDQNHISNEVLHNQKTLRLKFPVKRILDEESISQIATLTKNRYARFEIEQEGIQHLIEVLEEDLKLKVEYDGQAGIVFLPKGTFAQDSSGGMKIHVFGKMAMLVEKLQKELGFSGQEVLEKAIDLYRDILKHMSNGYKLVVEDKHGKEIESWRTIKLKFRTPY